MLTLAHPFVASVDTLIFGGMDHRSRYSAETPILSKVRPTDATAPEVRPKKTNSEVRKQQNRIASRNYREKRKRKLQQLQQLLEDDDDSSEQQAHARSASPYDDMSCSGSTGYERSVASASPHIAAVSGNFSSPQPGHAAIAGQTWIPPVPSPGEAFVYHEPYSSPAQIATIYSQSGLATTTCPIWITPPSTDSAEESTIDPSHAYSWPSSGFDITYAHVGYQQQATASSYMPSWQYHISGEVPAGVSIDPYGRRYNQSDSH